MGGIALVLVLFPLSGPAEPLGPGTHTVKLKHDGHDREMLVRLPETYDASRKYPVVFGFHGAGGPMKGYHRLLEDLVKAKGVISVSPQGVSNARGTTGWNGFSGHRISNTDDVGLVKQIVDHLDEQASIDRDRLYATGGSSGAIFCFRLAMETDLFAAIAPMRGAMIKRPPVPGNRPCLSILLVCGNEDPLFNGTGGTPREVFYPALETMGLWAANHGVTVKPEIVEDSDTRSVTRFSPPDAAYELNLYAVKREGHRLGRDRMSAALAYMGAFFERHPKLNAKPDRPPKPGKPLSR
jgi:poly(3-hydroxybutyrate) depolymerase